METPKESHGDKYSGCEYGDKFKIPLNLNSFSTPEEVLIGTKLTGRTAIITGATSGIGLETARALAWTGCRIILACRSVQLGRNLVDTLAAETGNQQIEYIHCDLSSLKSVRDFCNTFISRGYPLTYLILNAAVNGALSSVTEDGLDYTFQVNYFGHFFMTQLLKDSLKGNAPGRVVVVSSESHRQSFLSESNLQLSSMQRSSFSSFFAYNDSKLMGILFANELSRRWKEDRISAVSCHPGNLVSTNIQRNSWLLRVVYYFASSFTKTPKQAAATVVYSAILPEEDVEKTARYFNDCAACVPSFSAMNPNLAKFLWNFSESLFNEHLALLN